MKIKKFVKKSVIAIGNDLKEKGIDADIVDCNIKRAVKSTLKFIFEYSTYNKSTVVCDGNIQAVLSFIDEIGEDIRLDLQRVPIVPHVHTTVSALDGKPQVDNSNECLTIIGNTARILMTKAVEEDDNFARHESKMLKACIADTTEHICSKFNLKSNSILNVEQWEYVCKFINKWINRRKPSKGKEKGVLMFEVPTSAYDRKCDDNGIAIMEACSLENFIYRQLQVEGVTVLPREYLDEIHELITNHHGIKLNKPNVFYNEAIIIAKTIIDTLNKHDIAILPFEPNSDLRFINDIVGMFVIKMKSDSPLVNMDYTYAYNDLLDTLNTKLKFNVAVYYLVPDLTRQVFSIMRDWSTESDFIKKEYSKIGINIVDEDDVSSKAYQMPTTVYEMVVKHTKKKVQLTSIIKPSCEEHYHTILLCDALKILKKAFSINPFDNASGSTYEVVETVIKDCYEKLLQNIKMFEADNEPTQDTVSTHIDEVVNNQELSDKHKSELKIYLLERIPTFYNFELESEPDKHVYSVIYIVMQEYIHNVLGDR